MTKPILKKKKFKKIVNGSRVNFYRKEKGKWVKLWEGDTVGADGVTRILPSRLHHEDSILSRPPQCRCVFNGKDLEYIINKEPNLSESLHKAKESAEKLKMAMEESKKRYNKIINRTHK